MTPVTYVPKPISETEQRALIRAALANPQGRASNYTPSKRGSV